ncbi:MAG: MoaD/ThiS family protein [Planctomycetota bacterium]
MRIRVSTHLYAYTNGAEFVEAEGRTAAELLEDLDRVCPGLRFRVVDEQGRLRQHIHLFLDNRSVRDLSASLEGVQLVHLLGALSGG